MAAYNKAIFGIVAMAMIASQARASFQLENFIVFLDNPNLENLYLLMFWQIWSLFMPLVGGPVYVLLQYIWFYGNAPSVTYNSIVYTLSYRVIFGFAGIGNFNQIYELFMGLAPKIGINLAVQNNLLSTASKKAYSTTEDELLTRFGLKSAVGLT